MVMCMYIIDEMAELIRKTRTFRIDERAIEGLNELARKKNNSANRVLENLLIDVLKAEGILNHDFESLGETRGRD